MKFVVTILFLFFILTPQYNVFAALGPKLIINNEAKTCRSFAPSTIYSTPPDGWIIGAHVPPGDFEQTCKKMGYTFNSEPIFDKPYNKSIFELEDDDPRKQVAKIVKTISIFLALLFFVSIIYGGVQLKTKKDERTNKHAKSIIIVSIVFLVLIYALYSMSIFILSAVF